VAAGATARGDPARASSAATTSGSGSTRTVRRASRPTPYRSCAARGSCAASIAAPRFRPCPSPA
jgi:hypothetical protein